MRNVRSTNTAPELDLRKAVWARGFRYTLHKASLPGKPDIVFPSSRLVVFVDGDYWHGNQWRLRGLSSLADQFHGTSSKSYWIAKIYRNIARDLDVTSRLLSRGWKVLRFWESQILADLEGCVDLITDAMRSKGVADSVSKLACRSFADFFAGIGLIRMGLESRGWTPAFANDIDDKKAQMYRSQFSDSDGHYVVEDVHDLATDAVPEVSLATASFPCNDLSLAGSRSGLSGRQSSAFWGFARILEEMGDQRPPLVMLENVTGFISSRGGGDFKSVLVRLNALGYAVDAFVIDAVRFVPQSRPRLFVVGVNKDLADTGTAQEPTAFFESDVRPKVIADWIFDHPEIRWAIRSLPKLPTSDRRVESVLEDLPQDAPEWWNEERAAYLLNQMSSKHRAVADEMISQDSWSYGTVFRRVRNKKSMAELRTDGIAGCLRTPRGGSGRQILFRAGYGGYKVRLITPRECARLMGADEFEIDAPLNQALFGFGDAVCVPVVEWIAENYLNPLVSELIRGRYLSSTV